MTTLVTKLGAYDEARSHQDRANVITYDNTATRTDQETRGQDADYSRPR